ncbi:MAG TPA: ATP-dependent RNA helicase HrpA [Planctomycetaceae bacterium]|nr:ATP-dependent RNA helicase HrpA [Planctomycetaceae bacterium]
MSKPIDTSSTVGNLEYDEELPIVRRRTEILALIEKHQVLVVCGETGSGKSTQLPKFCLELGYGSKKMIGHTQPRRIAARSVAVRIAEELGTPLGQTVGYKVRFGDRTSAATRVKLMTDGILLAESQTDRFFNRYDTIIIDEAHERSLNIDFLLGIIKRILPKRKDLKLIITSATIDATRFADHFRDELGRAAPVIEVSGRTYPIDILYRPLIDPYHNNNNNDNGGNANETHAARNDAPDLEDAVLRAVDECVSLGSGDILLFLPTERDILESAKRLRARAMRDKTEILPLYARLPIGEQQRIFTKSPHRKIVLATNVAESSLTVPGIRFVIDSGTARISRYSGRSRTQRLPIEPISQASADQRAGRCGRVGPGVCIRLYDERDYRARDRYTTPEIQRTNLASVILQTKAFRLGPIERFPFLDPPRSSAISDGYKTLHEIGALDEHSNLTAIGRRLATLPVDPRIGRMVLASMEENCLREMLVIAAAMEIQDPRERPQEFREKADAAHERFADEQSDFLAYLKIWEFYRHLKSTLSRSQLHKACLRNFLAPNRMREWGDIHIQLQSDLREMRKERSKDKATRQDADHRNTDRENRENTGAADTVPSTQSLYAPLHRAILTGLLSGLAQREDRGEYAVAGGGRFHLWPGSGVCKAKKNYHWIISAERVETGRKYLRTVARIDTNWVEPLARHLLQRVYLEPHWNRETGYVHAYERLTLYGLTIVPKRRINFGAIDPKQARDIFIQRALVDDELDCNAAFVLENRKLLEEARRLQDKLRRPDLLLGEYARYAFYQARLPEDVYDRRSLEKWWKNATTEQRSRLRFSMNDLCSGRIDDDIATRFPDTLETPGGPVRIEYAFRPGESDDGLSVSVPIEGLRQLRPERLGWLVPGLIEQKIVALLRSLPKEVRRALVPIPDTARELARKLADGHNAPAHSQSLEAVLATEISRLAGKAITPRDFLAADIPKEMLFNVRVLDAAGELIAEGRRLEELRRDLGVKATTTVAATEDPRWNRNDVTDWDFGELPESVVLKRGGLTIHAYPMLIVETDTAGHRHVALRLADTLRKAELHTRDALVHLTWLKMRKEIATQLQWMPGFDKIGVYSAHLAEFDPKRDIGELLAARSLEIESQPIPRSEGGYRQRLAAASKRLGTAVQETTRTIGPLFETLFQVRLLLERQSGRFESSRQDAIASVDALTVPGFLRSTPWNWLREYPRYFKAVLVRFEKLASGGEAADRSATEELAAFRHKLKERLELNEVVGRFDPQLETFRWMLEEYRVSLFAQKLGTAVKVSRQRLEKQWDLTTNE